MQCASSKSLTCIVVIMLALSLAVPSTALAGTKGKIIGATIGIVGGVVVGILTGGIGVVPYGVGLSTAVLATGAGAAGAGVGYAVGDMVEGAVTPEKGCAGPLAFAGCD